VRVTVKTKSVAGLAVDILNDAITFTGPVGRLVEMFDAPFLKLPVNLVLRDRHGISWVSEAWSVLGLQQEA
jgi:hypothetical protein